MGEQQASRLFLTASLWDNGSVVIDEYRENLGRDHAVREGLVYSDKAPGQPFWAVPFYGIYRLAGGEELDPNTQATVPALWWVTVWSAVVPGAALTVLMYAWAAKTEPRTALAATLGISFGTLLLVYSALLFGHVLAATFVFGMFLFVRRRHATRGALAIAGVLGGAAVLVEFPVALIVAILTIAAILRHRLRAAAVIAGGVPGAVLMGIYNRLVTGSPFVTPIQWSGFAGVRGEANDVFGLFTGPSLERLAHVLFSERGLFIATPVIAVALVGIVVLYRRGERFDALTACFVFVSMLMIQGSWSSSYAGGAGPRYLVPALPFLVAPLAVAWGRWRRTTLFLAAVSILTMCVATLTEPQLGSDFPGGLGLWLALAGKGYLVPTIFTSIVGPAGWAVHVALIGLTLGLILRGRRPGDNALGPLLSAGTDLKPTAKV